MSELINPLKLGRGMFYGWWLVGLSALVMALGTVPLFQGMTAWFPVLETRFGWSRTQLALAFSFSRVEGSVMGPISGYLIEKLGPRRMVLIGLLILGGGFILFSLVQGLWQFYLAFIVISMGAGLGTWLPMMTVLNSWFIQRRSMAMAVAMDGFYVGGVIFVPVLAWAINPDEFGPDRWRLAAAAIGVIVIVLALPLSLLVRRRPEDYGLLPDGRPTTDRAKEVGPPVEEGEPDYTWQQAVRTRDFWLMSIGHACSSIVIVTITVHLGSMLNLDRGLSLQTVGWVVSIYTAVSAVFTLIGGYIGDRVSIRLALFGFSAIQSVAVIIILQADSAHLAFLFAVLLGIGFGGRSPLTTAIRGIYFGRRSFASITGVSMIPMNALLLGAPLFAGYMYDTTGSYNIPFITIAIVSLLGSSLFLLLGEPKPLSARKGMTPTHLGAQEGDG